MSASDTYTLTPPKGVQIGDDAISSFKDFARARNMSQQAAQELLEFGAAKLMDSADAPRKQLAATYDAWKNEITTDPEIGGHQLDSNMVLAARALDAFGGEGLRRALDETGAGNNPAVVKAFVRMGKLLAEPGYATGQPAPQPKSMAALLYPTLK